MADHQCKHENDFGKLFTWLPIINEKLDTIIQQQRLTNGRVTALERWRSATVTAVVVLALALGGKWAWLNILSKMIGG